MRLIDADALLLDNTWEWYDEYGNLTVAGRAVENAPTIDPVRHGRWVEHEDEEDTVHAHCSECGWEAHYYETDIVDEANYCPNCGARMDGDDNEID